MDEYKDPESALSMGGVDLEVVSTLERPQRPVDETWAWVERHDELINAMKEGGALFGFVEAPITFPPSFRWNAKTSAGNFTTLAELQGELTGTCT